MKSRKIVTFGTFGTSYAFSGGGVSQFWAKRLRFFSFSSFYPPPKGRRDLKIKTSGVISHGESDFRWIIYLNFWKKWKVQKSSAFVSPKIPKSKKSIFFSKNRCYPLKSLEFSCDHFHCWMTRIGAILCFSETVVVRFTPPPSEARSERSEVRAKRGSSYRGGLLPPPDPYLCFRLRRYGVI